MDFPTETLFDLIDGIPWVSQPVFPFSIDSLLEGRTILPSERIKGTAFVDLLLGFSLIALIRLVVHICRFGPFHCSVLLTARAKVSEEIPSV